MRRTSRALIVAAVVALPVVGTSPAGAQEAEVLRVIPHAPLTSLDPIWTTASITRNHGYMIYDTLFAMDENMRPQPQMVDTWKVSDDRLVWTFTLRDGLTFHDGAPVTSADVIASLRHWGARDDMGRRLMAAMAEMVAVDDMTFAFHLKEPYGLVLESIGKIGANVPFIMPQRVAATDPFTQIRDPTGSGPFVFEVRQWVPGRRAVYTRFEDYPPRDEPPSWAAGGKVVRVDKVIWTYIPDQRAAMNALLSGEADYLEQPAYDLAATLAADPDITVGVNDPIGNVAVARFNHLVPPFDDVAIRRAAVMAMDQVKYMRGAIGDEEWWRTCHSVYPCGTKPAGAAGAADMTDGDPAEARAALAATGYDGRPVVILQPIDVPLLSALSLITAERLSDAGFTVELQAMDWATLIARRASRAPADEGGWNIFHTWWDGADISDPMSIAFSGDPRQGWFGWPDDAELERLRHDYARAPTAGERGKIAAEVQKRLRAIAATGYLGQFFNPVAYRNDVTGLIRSPVPFFWNIDIAG